MAEAWKNKRVLIVEDDKFLDDLLAKRFSEEGVTFDLVTDGESALKKAAENKPDLMLLDLFLPGIDGYEVLKRVKESPALSSISVLILSNLGQKDEIDRGMKLGAIDFLVKANFDLSDIMAHVKAVLSKK